MKIEGYCQYCGQEQLETAYWYRENTYFVRCKNCKATGPSIAHSEQEAIELFNTRKEPEQGRLDLREVTELSVLTFHMGTDKEAAVKVLEEAAEAYSEWQANSRTRLADELADVIQAACNLAARFDIDMAGAMRRCEVRNRERGRYEQA